MAQQRKRIAPQTFLAQLPLFSALEPGEVQRIALGTTEVLVAKGDPVFQRGDPCHGFHVVIYGQIKLSLTTPGGAEKVVELIGAGHSFGEAIMFMDKPYIVTAQALADSLLLHVNKDTVMAELGRNPTFAARMLAGLSRRLHGLMSDLEAYTLHSGTQRVIGYLLKDDPEPDGEIRLPVTKVVLASRLNLTPEHFSRILHELAGKGLIELSGREVRIRDCEALRRYAG
ncbi:Crp/Fnr family transcriptional regulator [Massilia sp. TS11]|uniref:Crp/Fnr family transcriptional regulator n=1 Tax=Massilia sp. TS11 TaxID=2908003 RepID=UPI001ED9D628|nr:Crp/Fnr family transcriptional regulator [Massilia sp. TS11]MCG2585933.1 Crp/Fnr family transcriptional regulator [Massilia sp. TS11]